MNTEAKNELLYDDLHFILRRLPKDLREAMRKKPLFLAGGCIRSLVCGEPISDYDLFGPTKEFLEGCAKDLALDRKGKIWTTQNAFTVLAPPRTPVQFITRWLYIDPAELATTFDFTVCQAVIWFQPAEYADPKEAQKKGKWSSWISPRFYADLAAHRLSYTTPQRNEDAGGSMLRVVKFLRKGYNISPESLGRVIARLTSRIDHESWMAVEGETGIARLVISLLREVDPLTVVDSLEVVDDLRDQTAEEDL
jgi:hypothetical protein